MGARGCECGSDGAKRSRARSPPAARPAITRAPPQGILLVQLNVSALLEGLGARLEALRAFSPLPTEAVSEAGGVVARLPCCRPLCSATCFRAGPSSRTGSPTGRARVT